MFEYEYDLLLDRERFIPVSGVKCQNTGNTMYSSDGFVCFYC